MFNLKSSTKTHPREIELADFLAGRLSAKDKERVKNHIAGCDECLGAVVSGYESVKAFNRTGKDKRMKKFNIYLILAIITFMLSFSVPQHFLQFLVATLLLGTKWIVDSKTTRMLIMIHEAWKKGGEREASRILGKLDIEDKKKNPSLSTWATTEEGA